MPQLTGFLPITADTPSFLIPIFAQRFKGNELLVQTLDPEGRIKSFQPITIHCDLIAITSPQHLEVGESAYWAFRCMNDTIVDGTAATIIPTLDQMLGNGDFQAFPLIETQVARFCGDRLRYYNGLSRSYDDIEERSELTASIWRDAVVLLPAAKTDIGTHLANSQSGTLNTQTLKLIDQIRVVGTDEHIDVILPAQLHDSLGKQTVKFERMTPLAASFGVKHTNLIRHDTIRKATQDPPTTEVIFASVKAFTGIGQLVVRGLPSFNNTHYVFPAWVKRTETTAAPTPPICFVILNTNKETMDDASAYARSLPKTMMKIAVVTMPISFGTRSGGRTDVFGLLSLRPAFDYIFSIGNHSLIKPDVIAPRLSASSRAVKFVRACIDGFMNLVGAKGTPKIGRDFYRIFPRTGLCVVGRGLEKNGSQTLALREAVASMISEHLPAHFGKRAVVCGPPHLIDAPATLEFLENAAVSTTNETISIPSQTRGATILVFGIDPIKPTQYRFVEFCLELLQARDFEVHGRTTSGVTGSIFKGTFAFVFSRSGLIDSQEFHFLIKSKGSRCVLTSLSVNRSAIDEARRNGIEIIHYSSLDKYFMRHLDNIALP